MTKQEWENEKDINKLFDHINLRKKILFGIACCKNIKHLIEIENSTDFSNVIFDINHAAQFYFIMGLGSFFFTIGLILLTIFGVAPYYVCCVYCIVAAFSFCSVIYNFWILHKIIKEKETHIDILKDIYNPFLLDLKFSQQAISLAQEVYNTQDQTARFVLSDYLEEEGYPDEIVAHLKSGNHVKGCWLIDQILENSC